MTDVSTVITQPVPHAGLNFSISRLETFLVGRGEQGHLWLLHSRLKKL